jgi:uncharacterized membrane protein
MEKLIGDMPVVRKSPSSYSYTTRTGTLLVVLKRHKVSKARTTLGMDTVPNRNRLSKCRH